MHIYSKKSLRRMHAIPAAIMLLITVFLWLAMGRPLVYAETLLASDALEQWQQSCNRCVVEAQFDVLSGDVVRLESRRRLELTRKAPALPEHPVLRWHWTADASVDGGVLLRLTLQVQETDEWPARVLHYVWDDQAAVDEHRVVSDFEHVLVVSGQEQQSGRWHAVERTLDSDWQRLYGEQMPPLERLQLAVGMPETHTVAAGFVQQIELSSVAPAETPEPAIAITE